jgi:hypothetical protein
MKNRIDYRIATLTTTTVLLLSACNGQLAVVDDLGSRDPGSQDLASQDLASQDLDTREVEPGNGWGSVLAPDRCTCARSASLQPLACYDKDDAHPSGLESSADGSVVAFGFFGYDSAFPVFYWRSNAPTLIIASGLLRGLSASGEDVLVDSITEGAVVRIGPKGRSGHVRMGTLQGPSLLSADGNIAVGAVADHGAAGLARANMNTGEIEVLGQISGGVGPLYLNADASAIVGALQGTIRSGVPSSSDEDYAAFRWTEQGLIIGLPGVPAKNRLWPEAVSADGSVIAGRSALNGAHFRWSEADGYVEIASSSDRTETKLSPDGSVVLGSLDPEGDRGTSGFRWTKAAGAVEIVPGATTAAVDMSTDGSVIVLNEWAEDHSTVEDPRDTLIWDTVHGTRSLEDILHLRGVDTGDWKFLQAAKLSANGKVLIGHATCGGLETLYRAVLSDD